MKKPNYGLVIGYETETVLRDCNFIVNEKSRQRVLKERNKNVHAWIVGYGECMENVDIGELRPAYYNPYITNNFIDFSTKEIIKYSDLVVFTKDFRVLYK
jgi:hypothetical protein